jgi:hypothetical protein
MAVGVLIIHWPVYGGVVPVQEKEIVVEVGHREKCKELSYTGQYTHKLGD